MYIMFANLKPHQQNQLIKCAVHNQLGIIAKNLYVSEFSLPLQINSYTHVDHVCKIIISFANLKPHPTELINTANATVINIQVSEPEMTKIKINVVK